MDDLDYQLKLPNGIEAAIRFLIGNSREFGNNRHRALIARRLKHIELTAEQSELAVDSILNKLQQGDIDEQFIDQLRLCHHLNRDKTRAVASSLLETEKDRKSV